MLYISRRQHLFSNQKLEKKGRIIIQVLIAPSSVRITKKKVAFKFEIILLVFLTRSTISLYYLLGGSSSFEKHLLSMLRECQ